MPDKRMGEEICAWIRLSLYSSFTFYIFVCLSNTFRYEGAVDKSYWNIIQLSLYGKMHSNMSVYGCILFNLG